MTFETPADRQIFVRDFGESVTFRGPFIGFKQATAIFDNEYAGIQGESVEFATSQPILTCVSDDVRGVAFGDTVEVRSKTYKIVLVMQNGTGMSELMLELQ
jgi:hypothetical protein